MGKKYYCIEGVNWINPRPSHTCPECGHLTLGANFYPYDRKCPQCKKIQSVSSYNVRVTCCECGFKGWRDDFIWPITLDD
jgi:phage FluMu protein Com